MEKVHQPSFQLIPNVQQLRAHDGKVGHVDSSHPEFAVHDTFRQGFSEVSHGLIPGHSLEKHLLNVRKF